MICPYCHHEIVEEPVLDLYPVRVRGEKLTVHHVGALTTSIGIYPMKVVPVFYVEGFGSSSARAAQPIENRSFHPFEADVTHSEKEVKYVPKRKAEVKHGSHYR